MIKKFGLKLKEQKGFTLIELLAVIVILGIIAAIAIPAIGNVIEKSRDKAAIQEGVQIINAAKLYVADDNVIPPAGVAYSDLDPYLDRIEDENFTVTIEPPASGGTDSYVIVGHRSNTALKGNKDTKASEQELADGK